MTSTPPPISSPRSAFTHRNIAAVGFCMGGTVSFFAATLVPSVRRQLLRRWGHHRSIRIRALGGTRRDLRCPWLGLYGDLDQSIPVDQVEALREATNAAPVRPRSCGTPRASTVSTATRDPIRFNEAAATDARGRALAFFAEHLSDK